MKAHLLSFFKQFTFFVFIIGIATYIIQGVIPQLPIYRYWPAILFFLYAFTFYLYWQLANYFGERLSKFTNALMLVNFGKMMFYTLVILVFIWYNRGEALSFSLTFLVYYALISVFEIRALLKIK